MSLIDLKTVDDPLNFINNGQYGNMACLFTSSGANARKFRSLANAGNIGINIGGSRTPWPSFRSAVGRIVSLAIYMARDVMQLNSLPKQKW
jgi:acyl-CoA reductase-like NAD-dependent aldehyde dehydrogenase